MAGKARKKHTMKNENQPNSATRKPTEALIRVRGTALRLGEALAEARGWSLEDTANYHREGIIGERPHKEIGVQTLRGGDVVGVHTVYFLGQGERIEINHQAHSREMFAKGAVRAAVWLSSQKPGKLYGMPDMLDI